MNIGTMIREAYDVARAVPARSRSVGSRHCRRSGKFVECLASEFRSAHEGMDDVAVLSLDSDSERRGFGMNELLFDITVLSFGTLGVARARKPLPYVIRGLWLVESELAKDKHQALIDFNKLILGRADHKLFVGALVDRNERDEYLKVLRTAALHCEGEIHLALIPHPEDWDEVFSNDIEIYSWADTDWRRV